VPVDVETACGMNAPDLSIVIPTCDRPTHLAAALASLSEIAIPAEIIVVDGSSDDQTATVAASAREDFGDRLTYLREERREGFVRAVNKGFRAARGRCLTWLNDDARPVRSSLESAVAQLLTGPSDVGLVAMFHRWQSPRNVAFTRSIGKRSYQLCHVRGTLYANFGVGLRATFERLGFFDERYYFYPKPLEFHHMFLRDHCQREAERSLQRSGPDSR
jgi:GT2 family glycosyltransferase